MVSPLFTLPRTGMTVCIVGAGPAGLMAAETVARGGLPVVVYDAMPSAGRKFLMAGRGGLNLTHSEDLERFLDRYGGARARLRAAIEAFPPDQLRAWAEGLGQKTFVGSSGRVFPEAMKASPLLRAWLRRLGELGVRLLLRHRWTGWSESGALTFDAPQGAVSVEADATVFALGGASWPRLGSDGGWIDVFRGAGIAVAPLRPANGGVSVRWSQVMRERFAGAPLKRIAISFGGKCARGEAVVSRGGLEGGAIYALSGILRDALDRDGKALIHIDLRPDMSADHLAARLDRPRGRQSLATFLRKAANLAPVATGLLHEAGKPAVLPPRELAALIKAVPVTLAGMAPLARAISTAGGISLDEVDGHFMLRKMPGTFAAGEMLDWEAPTGGYLLQASFATGLAAGKGALAFAQRSRPR